MANASIGGLVSGLDTATIISQLIQLEARPQSMLKSRMSTEQRALTAMQTLNAKLASIATKAEELSKAQTWSARTATSSNDKVTVTADASAAPSTISFTVNGLATAASRAYAMTGTVDEPLMAANAVYGITYDDGRTFETFETGDGSLRDIAEQLNQREGVRATLIRVGVAADGTTPTYKLHVTSTTTGENSGFTIAEVDPADPPNPPASPVPFLGSIAAVTNGSDASITLEGQATPLTFSSNTITDLMPGVDVTLLAGATGDATITVAQDTTAMTDKVKAFVDGINAALDEVSSLTAYNSATKSAGLLAGDSTMRDVRNRLLSAVTGGVGGKSLEPYGIETDRNGKLVFDAEKFKAAYTADPVATAAMFTTPAPDAPAGTPIGFAAAMHDLTDSFSDSIDGTVTAAITGRTTLIDRMEDDIADWDVRLEMRRTALQRQYGALEVALGKLQSQSQWLAGQIGSLPQMSSGQ